jgi:hypothetical protein
MSNLDYAPHTLRMLIDALSLDESDFIDYDYQAWDSTDYGVDIAELLDNSEQWDEQDQD